MNCPYCKSTITWVVSTWDFRGRIRRTRRCRICGRRFSTLESMTRNQLRPGRPVRRRPKISH